VLGAAAGNGAAAIGACVAGWLGLLGLVLGLVLAGELSQDCTARGTPIVPATSISCAQSAPF
jgi:hypothetical protein